MKKILLSLIISVFFISSAVYAADNLFEYYQERGEQLPAISERSEIYRNIASDAYKGSYEQNVSLLDHLVSIKPIEGQNEGNLGGLTGSAHLPQVIANFEDSLATKITSTATSLTLADGTTPAGNTLSGWYGLTLDAGSSNQEYIIGSCAGTACTSLTRGLSTDTGTSTVATLKFEHRRGASVKITDYPNLTIITNILNGADGIPDKLYYDSQPTITSNEDVATKKYVDDVALVSAPDATETVKGVVELGTQTEVASTTPSGSAARLAIPASMSTSSPDVRGLYIPVAKNNGYLDQGWLDLSEDFAFSGDNTYSGIGIFSGENTFTATSTMATTTTVVVPSGNSDVTNKLYVDDGDSHDVSTVCFSGGLLVSNNAGYLFYGSASSTPELAPENITEMIVTASSTIDRLYVQYYGNNLADVGSVTLRKNYSNTALTVSVPAGNSNLLSDLVHSSLAPVGTKITIYATTSGGGGAGPYGIKACFRMTTDE
ncbi:MAG: hypothetical protein WC619_01810 [Patescibacteria group bacterium]